MRIHFVRNTIMTMLGYSSKINAERAFLQMLRDEGWKAADEFLDVDGDNIGKRSSVDLTFCCGGA